MINNEQNKFGEIFLLFQQEAFLARSSLLTGLNALANANTHEKGNFYAASFQLSIGIERIMKMIILINSLIENNLETIGVSDVRSYGHNLEKLFLTCSSVEKIQFNTNNLLDWKNDTINQNIFSYLTSFSEKDRYYNLDTLVKGRMRKDPLESLDEIIHTILSNDVSQRKIQKFIGLSTFLESKLSEVVFSSDGRTHREIFLPPMLIEEANKFLIYRIYNLLGQLLKIIDSLDTTTKKMEKGNGYPTIPFMNEFFRFLYYEKKDVLRKRKWP